MADKPVSEMTREELNAYAASLRVENPEAMKNMDEVRAAIDAAAKENGQASTPDGDEAALRSKIEAELRAQIEEEARAAPDRKPDRKVPWVSNDRTGKKA